MLILHVTYTAKPGMAHRFVEELEQGPALKVRAEKGNICYDYFFSSSDQNKILLVEKWQDEDALALHMETPQMREIRLLKEEYIQNSVLEKFSVQLI